jgi:hypothetical protein
MSTPHTLITTQSITSWGYDGRDLTRYALCSPICDSPDGNAATFEVSGLGTLG